MATNLSKELRNIPISISILHEQEYNNIYSCYKLKSYCKDKRRAYTEKKYKKPHTDEVYNIITLTPVIISRHTLNSLYQ
jgi:hypothetical protein